MVAVVDNIIAARIIYLLVLPFTKWEAFKQGIIDADGERTDKDVGDSDDWSMLHRLVARLKKILGQFPGGKGVIASIAAAYLLVRECVERDIEPALLEDYYNEAIDSDQLITFNTFKFIESVIDQIDEDAVIGNTVGSGQISGATPGEEPPVKYPAKFKKKVMKRNANLIVP